MTLSRRTAVFIALAGLLAVSHSVIFIRMADAPSLIIAFARVALATAIFAPFAAVEYSKVSRADPEILHRSLGLSLLSGLFLAGHFGTWIASLETITIAESAVLVSLTPVWIALIDLVAGRGVPPRKVALSIALCLAGTAVIAFDGMRRPDGDPFGLALATMGGICMAGYLLAGRSVRAVLPTQIYVTVCYGTAAVALAAAASAFGLSFTAYTAETYMAMAALGLVSQVIGHTSYNWTLSILPPVFVSICLLGEPVLGSLLGWLYLREAIPVGAAVGGAIILVGIYLAIRAELRTPSTGG